MKKIVLRLGSIDEGLSCCGMRDAYGLQSCTPMQLVMEAYAQRFMNEDRFGMIVLSCVKSFKKEAKAFKSFVKKNKLGSIVMTEPTHNPNSGNQIIGLLWSIDQEGLRKYGGKNWKYIANASSFPYSGEDEDDDGYSWM